MSEVAGPQSVSNRGDADDRRLVLIDTDCGLDDAQAIILILANPDRAKIVAVTTVDGNTSAINAYKNVKYVLKKCGHDVETFVGRTDTPYVPPEEDPYHGHDGLGDMPDREDKDDVVQPPDRDAVDVIIDSANLYRGKLDLLMLGPLTNLAKALKKDPELGEKLRSCTIMGGNYAGQANFKACSEYNFGFDPPMAKYALENLNCSSTWMICLETCHQTRMEWNLWTTTLDRAAKPMAEFVRRMDRTVRPKIDSKWWCDEVAAVAYLFPDAVIKKELQYCTVETKGEFTTGQMVVDRRGFLGKSPNCNIVRSVDLEIFRREIILSLTRTCSSF